MGWPSLADLTRAIGGRAEPVLVPWDCADGFFEAYWRRLEAYLDEHVRRAVSVWTRVGGPVVDGRCLLGQLGELLVEDVTYGVVAAARTPWSTGHSATTPKESSSSATAHGCSPKPAASSPNTPEQSASTCRLSSRPRASGRSSRHTTNRAISGPGSPAPNGSSKPKRGHQSRVGESTAPEGCPVRQIALHQPDVESCR